MPRVSSCPQGDAIDRYLDDRLPAAESSGLETHLSSCPTCEDRLRAALKSDPLLPLARSGPGGSWSVPVVLRNRLLDLCAASTDTNGTVAQDTSPVAAFERPPELVAVLHPPQGSDEIGRLPGYRILKVLGKGGMGVVCLGVDEKLNRRVAIKLILPGMAADPRATAMFLREARALAAAPHDNVVTVFQVGQDGETPFLVMEFLEGETVAHWMKNNPSRCLGDVLRIAREAIAGLAYAHSKGVIHRDFKPANLWRTAGSGRVKLLDFGLARQPENEPLTAPGQVMGTAAYMAPEQAKGTAVDARADLFSFGVVLHELCSGVSPFARPHYINSLVAVSEYHPDPLDRTHPWLPADLVTLATDLLAKDPAARVQTAEEVAARIQRIEADATRKRLLNRLVGETNSSAEAESPVRNDPAAPARDAVASEKFAHQRRQWRSPARRRVWAAGITAGFLALAGLVYGLSGNGQQKGDPDKPRAEVPQPDEKKPPKEGPVTPPPPPGEPVSALAMTKTPAKYFAEGPWTLDTTGARKPVNAIAYQPGGTLIALGSEDGTIRLYEAATGKFQKALVTRGAYRELAWTPDGKYLVVSEANAEFTTIRDIETGKVIREIDVYLHHPSVSPDGSQLAGCSANTVLVFDLTKIGKPLELALPKTTAAAIAWHPKSTQLMVGYADEQVRVWDMTKQKPEVVREFDARVGPVSAVAWHSERRYAIGGSGSLGYAIWLDDKRIAGGGGLAITTFGWSPKGDALLICSSPSSYCFIIDTTNAEGKGKRLEGRPEQGNWSPDGKQIALLSDGSSRVVDRNDKLLFTIPMFDRDLHYNAQKGYFIPPQKGENPFVFVVQTKDGQKTYTPDAFEKLTGGKWKNDPDSLK